MASPLPAVMLCVVFTVACAGSHGASVAPGAGVASAQVPGDTARCAAVADSVRASTPVYRLAIATPVGRPQLPIPRGQMGGEIHTTFLVDPTGRAVKGTVTTTGAGQGYQAEMEDVVLRTRFRPPVVAGCKVWGRGDFMLLGVVRRVTRP